MAAQHGLLTPGPRLLTPAASLPAARPGHDASRGLILRISLL
jgi:hypothetical protein